MVSREFGEHGSLAQELFIGISIIGVDVLVRSGLQERDIKYSSIGLSRFITPDKEIVLDINTTENGSYQISFLEHRRIQDSKDEVLEIGTSVDLELQNDGNGLNFKYPERDQTMTLAEAAQYLIRRLPDFDGAAATIEVIVPEAQ